MKLSICFPHLSLVLAAGAAMVTAACSGGPTQASDPKPRLKTTTDAGHDAAIASKHDAGADGGHLDAAKDGLPDDVAEDAAIADATDDVVDDAPNDTGSTDSGSNDSGSVADCTTPIAPGDLVLRELMVASRGGVGDIGEWVEIVSTRSCRMNIKGIEVVSPRGASQDVASVTSDLWVLPGETLVVANTDDPNSNNNLPGTVITWSGHPGDVLRNSGDTVTIFLGTTVIDTLTYPDLFVTPGVSVTFPDDCNAQDRNDWNFWVDSNSSWANGLVGTPNAPNVDVTCL
jgi:hypothetical protein